MKITGTSLIVDWLVRQQAKYVFLVPGKSIDPLIREIAASDRLTGIVATSELGSGYMADGYARASGKLGVCMSTGGPGASNLLTAAVNARLEASNVLFLTGDVPATSHGLGYFHDSSAVGTRSVQLFQQALGCSSAIDRPNDLFLALDRALSNTPAHLAIGLDIQSHDYRIATPVDLQLADCQTDAISAAASIVVAPLERLCQYEVSGYEDSHRRVCRSPVNDKTIADRPIFATCNESIDIEWPSSGATTVAALMVGSRNNIVVASLERLKQRCTQMLDSRPKTIVLVGARAISHGRADELLEFVETYHLPVATTISAKGAISETHPLSLGTFGHGGNQRANQALIRDDVDTLLLVGLDFNQNESLEWDARLYPDRRQVIRIDCLPRQFPPTVKIDLELIVDDCTRCLQELAGQSQQQLQNLHRTIPQRSNWLAQIQAIPWHWSIAAETCQSDRCLPLDELIRSLQRQMPAETILCADAGTTRVFAGHSWISRDASSFFTSSQLAPMGWAIGAGIGIQLAHPDRRTIVLTGDGSMLMHGLEITTAARYRLPILFVICNNQGYGTVYQRLQTDVERNFARLPAINWVQFAGSLGVAARQVSSMSELNAAIAEVLAAARPFVLEVSTPLTYSIY